MLGDNTSKLTWTAVAVGVAGLVGASTLVVYPDAFDSAKTVATSTIKSFTQPKDATLADGYPIEMKQEDLASVLTDGAITMSAQTAYAETGIDEMLSMDKFSSTISKTVSDATGIASSNTRFTGLGYVFDGGVPVTSIDSIKADSTYNVGFVVANRSDSGAITDSGVVADVRIVNIKVKGSDLINSKATLNTIVNSNTTTIVANQASKAKNHADEDSIAKQMASVGAGESKSDMTTTNRQAVLLNVINDNGSDMGTNELYDVFSYLGSSADVPLS